MRVVVQDMGIAADEVKNGLVYIFTIVRSEQKVNPVMEKKPRKSDRLRLPFNRYLLFLINYKLNMCYNKEGMME